MKVNFVDEYNLFMRFARNNQLNGRERLLWMALFTIANDRATYNAQTREYQWPGEFFPVPNGELSLNSTLDKRGIEAVRNSLKQRGLIDFRAGFKNKRPPEYKINYLSVNVGYKIVPNDVPNNAPNHVPNNVPNYVPNMTPFNLNINNDLNEMKSLSVDDDAHASAEHAVDRFLAESGLGNDGLYGVDQSMYERVKRITEKLYSNMGVGQQTEADCMYVYQLIRNDMELDPDRAELLAYAFQQANMKGCPGNWQYIAGVMQKLHERGIRTLAEAEEYDESRCAG